MALAPLFEFLARRSALASSALLLACVSCAGNAGNATDAGAPSDFVAYASSFDGFHSWKTSTATAPSGASDGLHVGPLQVYWSQSPPHGATSFPVGTIIVKESVEADVTQRVVFAMVKRGDGYNAAGANGWEWFSLQDQTDGSVTILWRGLVAPPGQTYANQTIGDCNGCHSTGAKNNDAVWDTALQLSAF